MMFNAILMNVKRRGSECRCEWLYGEQMLFALLRAFVDSLVGCTFAFSGIFLGDCAKWVGFARFEEGSGCVEEGPEFSHIQFNSNMNVCQWLRFQSYLWVYTNFLRILKWRDH